MKRKYQEKLLIPQYLYIFNEIKKRIENMEIKGNEKLLSESEYGEYYGASRTTIRRALDLLEQNELIYKVKGKGTYAKNPKIIQNRSKFSMFYDEVKCLGKMPKSKIISSKVEVPSEEIKEKMNLKNGELIFKLVWVRFCEEEALIYETINLNYSMVKGIENYALENIKLYKLLFEEFQVDFDRGEEKFYPCKLNEIEAKILGKRVDDLGMKVERTLFNNSQIIEFTQSIVRGDRFIYTTCFEKNYKGEKR